MSNGSRSRRWRGWRFEPDSGDLTHESGTLLPCAGDAGPGATSPLPSASSSRSSTSPRSACWAVLAKRFDGVLHFLLQAKMEPGNIDLVPVVADGPGNAEQLHARAWRQAPTLPRLLSAARQVNRVLVDQLQSEQGLFFLRKRNRNIIVETRDGRVPLHDDFHWLTLGQIKTLMQGAAHRQHGHPHGDRGGSAGGRRRTRRSPPAARPTRPRAASARR